MFCVNNKKLEVQFPFFFNSVNKFQLVNNIKKRLAVNINNINNNIVVKFYIILKCKFESIWQFAIFLIIFAKVY